MRKLKFFTSVLAISGALFLMPVARLDAQVAPLLVAQADNTFSFGAGFNFVIPTGDLSRFVSMGFGPSVFVERPFGDHFVLKAEADYIKFVKRPKHDLDMAEWGMSVQGNWYFYEDKLGPYLLATLGFSNATYTWDTEFSSNSDRASYLNYSAGFGYQFSRTFAVQLRIGRIEHEIGHLFHKNLRLPSDFLLSTQQGKDAIAKGSPIAFVPKELSWAVAHNKGAINDGKKLLEQSGEPKNVMPPKNIVGEKRYPL